MHKLCLCTVLCLPVIMCAIDKRNKRITCTAAGRKYTASVISALRKVELFAVEKLGIERMRQLNESMVQFVKLFEKAGNLN